MNSSNEFMTSLDVNELIQIKPHSVNSHNGTIANDPDFNLSNNSVGTWTVPCQVDCSNELTYDLNVQM